MLLCQVVFLARIVYLKFTVHAAAPGAKGLRYLMTYEDD